MDATQSLLLSIVMMAVVAIVVFESAKHSLRTAYQTCICGHRNYYVLGFGGHVRPLDWDSKAYIDGAEYNPGQCRECRCRNFIPK